MKKILTVLLMQCFCIGIHAQYGSKGVYATNRQPAVLGINPNRDIYGGSVIIPRYVGSGFNPTIRNAFSYACKIWEEQIPTTYPLNIEVRMGSLAGDSTLAMVEPQFSIEDVLSSQVVSFESGKKENAVVKRHAQLDGDWRIGENIYIESTDAIITFNTNKAFSYKTDTGIVASDKYDFISVAIQAIGKALGFYLMAYYDGTYLNAFSNGNMFTKYVMNNNQTLNYQYTINSIDGTPLYHPSVYDGNYALSYFDIDSSNDETLFMQPGIALGTSIRYIGEDMQKVFQVLNFEREITTGTQPPTNNEWYSHDSTEVGLDYNWGDEDNSMSSHRSAQTSPLSYTNYFQECLELQPVGSYVLKTNGAWQRYTTLGEIDPRDTIYARSFDGYLRTMDVRFDGFSNPYVWTYTNYVITHKLYKCPPMRPVFDLNSYTVSEMDRKSGNPRRQMCRTANTTLTDDDFLDVEIGFEKTEGCTSILVEQTDSDWPIPYTYFVDPSEGHFTAYMTRQNPSTFKLTYINSKGEAQSQPKVIDLSSTLEMFLMARTFDNGRKLQYTIDGNYSATSFSGTYSITNLNTNRIVKHGSVDGISGNIDISDLPSSLYSFTVRDNKNKLFTTKWRKQ